MTLAGEPSDMDTKGNGSKPHIHSVTSYRYKLLSRNSMWPGVLGATEVTVGGWSTFLRSQTC